MTPEKLNVIFPEGKDKAELIIRELNDEVKDRLPVLEPEKVEIFGNITAPFAFLEKRWDAADSQIDKCRTHLLVNREGLCISLVVNETDKRNRKTIGGRISLSRQYKEFGLNFAKEWIPEDLGDFIRVNRTYFESRDVNMVLVNALKSFKAKVSVSVERMQKDNGSMTDCYRQAVDASLPEKFFLNIPIFKGTDPEKIEVEVIARVSGRDVTLELISSDAAAIEEEVRDKLIDEQLDKIRELAPEIPIIEV